MKYHKKILKKDEVKGIGKALVQTKWKGIEEKDN